MNTRKSFQCSVIMSFLAVILSLVFSLMFNVDLLLEKTLVSFVEFLIMFVLISYLIVPNLTKTLFVDENGIDIFYSLRFFSRHFKCKHESIKCVLCDCGKSNDIYIKIRREKPFFFVKNKYVYFPCKSREQMRDIVCILREKNVKVKFRGNKRNIDFIER